MREKFFLLCQIDGIEQWRLVEKFFVCVCVQRPSFVINFLSYLDCTHSNSVFTWPNSLIWSINNTSAYQCLHLIKELLQVWIFAWMNCSCCDLLFSFSLARRFYTRSYVRGMQWWCHVKLQWRHCVCPCNTNR